MKAEKVDLLARTKAMAVLHKTYAVTGGICVGAAALIEGTVVNEITGSHAKETGEIRIGHPSGVLEVFVDIKQKAKGEWDLQAAGVCRTAKPIMEGMVYVDKKLVSCKQI